MLSHVTTSEIATSWALGAVAVATTLTAFVIGRVSARNRLRRHHRAEDANQR